MGVYPEICDLVKHQFHYFQGGERQSPIPPHALSIWIFRSRKEGVRKDRRTRIEDRHRSRRKAREVREVLKTCRGIRGTQRKGAGQRMRKARTTTEDVLVLVMR